MVVKSEVLGPKQRFSAAREISILSFVKSSREALGEIDLIEVRNQLNQRRIFDKELLELYEPSSPTINIIISDE